MNFVITFGQIHTHIVNGVKLHKDVVAVISADDENHARHKAFEYFKGVFHNCIEESSFDEQKLLQYFPDGKRYVEIDVCTYCGHSVENNEHKPQKCDYIWNEYYDRPVHSGHCSECKECNEQTDTMLEQTGIGSNR